MPLEVLMVGKWYNSSSLSISNVIFNFDKQNLKCDLFCEVFLLRLSPITPYSLLSYLLATTKIGTFLFLTSMNDYEKKI
jgi:uncharacterized membrane protein YdjX (TVP38/TMEM64 family)